MSSSSSAQTPHLLASVLGFLDLLSRGVHSLLQSLSDLSVVRLELLERLDGIVDQAEACGLGATVLNSETENNHSLRIGDLEHLSYFLLQLSLGNRSSAGVDHINDHLSSVHEGVSKELSNSNSYVGITHLCEKRI